MRQFPTGVPPENITFEGDSQACTLLLPLARQMARRAWLAGQQVCQMQPTADSYIRAEITNGLARIIIRSSKSGLYMETGFYVFDTITSPPVDGQGASVNYNTSVLGLLSEADPDQGAVEIDPLETGDAILGGEDLPSGFRSRAFLYGPGVDSSGFAAKHEAMTKVPPSVFAGKLRLLVQALYGSRRRDISYAGGISNMPILSWQGETINPIARGAVHTGLLTTENYDYFLMQVGGGEANFTKLEFSPAGNEIIELLRANAFSETGGLSSTKTRAEAFLLSTAKLSADPEDYHEVTFTAPEGFIPWYGWQWNWDGTEGEAVTHQWEDTGSTHYIVARHYRLTVTADLVEGVYSFSITPTLIKSANWHRSLSWFAFLRPFPANNKLINEMFSGLFPAPEFTLPDAYESFDAPVYCFRNSDDEIEVCQVSQAIQHRTDTQTFSDNWVVFPNNQRWTGSTVHNGPSGTVSVSCGGISYSGAYEAITSESYSEKRVVSINGFSGNGARSISTGTGANNPHASGGLLKDYLINSGMFETVNNVDYRGKATGGTVVINGSTRTVFYGARWAVGNRSAWRKSNNSSGNYRTPRVCITIPYDSCSSVFIARQQYEAPLVYTEGFQENAGTSNIRSKGQFITGYSHPSTSNWTLLAVVSNMEGLMHNVGAQPVSYVNTSINEPAKYNSNMGALIDSQVVSVGSKTTEVYDYFNFSLEDMFVETPDFVKNSITDGYRFNTGYLGWMGTEVNEDYPGSVSVGWA